MELGNNIKELRKQKGLRQEQLAEAMGVSTASVSKWETNQSYPELTLLAELADFFEVSIDTLVGHSLNADRMEALIAQMEKAVENRDDETAASLCKKILRNYPNSDRAVDTCADCYYRLFIYTNKKIYMEHCIAQTKRLMSLKQGEPERERLERIHYLGNQYGLLQQWDTAKEYYEQSNVSGSSDASIAECLLKQGQQRKAIGLLSDVLAKSVFRQFQAVNILADCWLDLGETETACAALKWAYTVMESIRYNPTTMLLLQVKLAGHYQDLGKLDAAEEAIRKAAALVKDNSPQEVAATAEFLQIENAKKMLISMPESNREMLMDLIAPMGGKFVDIANEVLQ